MNIFLFKRDLLVSSGLCTVLLLTSLKFCTPYSLEEELTLTLPEKKLLDKFRNDVFEDLPHDYMKTEAYLIKWLRAANFDPTEAKRMIRNNLKWRAENKIDEIMSEDFSDLEKQFPYWLDGTDYENRPVGTADVSVWDPRRAILGGKRDKLFRYATRIAEMGSAIVRESQAAGVNVSQFTIIVNLDGFNLVQHGCLRCIPLYINFLLTYQNHYPGYLHKLFLVNTPASFDTLLRIALPLLTQQIKDALSIHGLNKREWQKEILEVVPADEIRPQFGGTKPTEYDY